MMTQSQVKMAPVARLNGNFDEDFERDIEELIREQQQQQQQSRATFDLDREDLNIFRSGSAPPTVEGSRNAFRSLIGQAGFIDAPPLGSRRDPGGVTLSEEEMRSHPAYLSYYYSNENLNPRMPPPAVSKEDWRARQRAVGASLFGKIGDRRKDSVSSNGNTSSLFSLQPGERAMMEKNLAQQNSGEWLDRSADVRIGLPDVGLGTRRKSFADALQGELSHPTFGAGNLSRPASRNTYDNVDLARGSDSQLMQLHNASQPVGDFQSGGASGLVRVHSIGSSISQSFAPVLGSSLARSKTPDAQLFRRSASPCLLPVGVRNSDGDKHMLVRSNGLVGASSHTVDSGDLAATISGLSLSKNINVDAESHVQRRLSQEFSDQPEGLFDVPGDHRQFLQNKVFDNSERQEFRSQLNHYIGYNDISNLSGGVANVSLPKLVSNGQVSLPKQSSCADIYKKVSSEGASSVGSNGRLPNADISEINFSGSNLNLHTGSYRLPVALNSQLDSDAHHLDVNGNQVGSGFQLPLTDSTYGQYLRSASHSLVHGATSSDPSLGRSYLGASHLDLPGYQSPYLEELLAHQKLQYGVPYLSKTSGSNHGFFGNHAFGIGMPYPASPVSSIIHSPFGSGNHVRHNERLSRVHSATRSAVGDSHGSWISENGAMGEGYASSLLEEFKNNKTRSFELSDIIGHVVEFSADQYGSRFIQQKLETASVEEKNEIFPEILPKAHSLMTDVFGNYVIQKFFEHGTEVQRKQLAGQLTGNVLPLSLQMYGCRVIQKALEVVDVDQQTQMVLELDGHIMKCVRDQNGNHVIQKSIECVPQEKIHFIIEVFYGHVVALSTHPYGCRVIQRVLEFCDDANTQKIMMDEILQSVCTLAQDQYGNYVIQHVLQHGKQEERSAIVSKLFGQIVKMSHQKYASNVIEKCLTHGTPDERQLLINEMLGSTDENEPLQAMMKDQFANYVVQKVIETCDDKNRELILSRIKVHLNALKRYTYGKHIVSRVEKLVAAGEKRIGVSSYSS